MKCLRCSGSFDCIQSLMKLFPEIKRKQWRNIMDKAGETTNSCSQEIQNNGLYQFRIFSQLFLLAFSFLKQTTIHLLGSRKFSENRNLFLKLTLLYCQ